MGANSKSLLSRRDVAVAAISFAISGVGGAYFQRWVSRARPSIEIVSLGFDGGPDPFKLPEELVQKSVEDSWGKNLAETSTFDALRSRYRSTISLIRRHETVIPLVDRWLQENKSRIGKTPANPPVQLTAVEINAHSIMQDELMASALFGSIRRLQLDEPPITEFSHSPYRLSVSDPKASVIVVQYQGKSVHFPLSEMDSQEKRRLLTLLAESIARGVLTNMLYYSEFFVNAARADLLKLRALEESLRDVLTREARLTLQVALRNSGETATVFRQYYAAALRSKQYSSAFLVTPIDEKTKRPSSNGLLERLARDVANDGDEPEPPASDDLSKILPSARGSHLSGIAAGEVKQLTLQTMRPLGNDGKQIVAVFQDDVIECDLYGFLADGSMIASNRVPFGKSAMEREQNEVLQRASHKV